MRELLLSQGKVAKISDEDYEYLSKFKWSARTMNGNVYYAFRKCPITKKTVMMHREIMFAPKGLSVDHIDHDGLNNQRENLRIVKQSENCRNALMRKCNKSGCMGVIWLPKKRCWKAYITKNKDTIVLGVRKDKEKAIKLRKDAEILYGFHKNHGKTLEEIRGPVAVCPAIEIALEKTEQPAEVT